VLFLFARSFGLAVYRFLFMVPKETSFSFGVLLAVFLLLSISVTISDTNSIIRTDLL
jgi:hypothetical protein